MFQSDMPLRFWNYAVLTATFLINRLPSKTFDFNCPYLLLYQKDPPRTLEYLDACLSHPLQHSIEVPFYSKGKVRSKGPLQEIQRQDKPLKRELGEKCHMKDLGKLAVLPWNRNGAGTRRNLSLSKKVCPGNCCESKGCPGRGILLRTECNLEVYGFCDSDWVMVTRLCLALIKKCVGYALNLNMLPYHAHNSKRMTMSKQISLVEPKEEAKAIKNRTLIPDDSLSFFPGELPGECFRPYFVTVKVTTCPYQSATLISAYGPASRGLGEGVASESDWRLARLPLCSAINRGDT
ncbi:hypothetical protein M569_00063 [Genlisea aurea]|uniref:Uncharacterized protein n=1 Tax=Genlisea aurea TaxID=192259 RepID=S8EF86_9LAMI|nr:hypothetical protein M569_00063 [Genlisea aurea]